MKLLPDIVFICGKCGHNLFVDAKKWQKILKTDCPECGEEAHENWIIARIGNYDKEYS